MSRPESLPSLSVRASLRGCKPPDDQVEIGQYHFSMAAKRSRCVGAVPAQGNCHNASAPCPSPGRGVIACHLAVCGSPPRPSSPQAGAFHAPECGQLRRGEEGRPGSGQTAKALLMCMSTAIPRGVGISSGGTSPHQRLPHSQVCPGRHLHGRGRGKDAI